MIDVRNVTKHYRMGRVTVEALKGISLLIHKGELVCVAGPSGSGKTTLLNLIGLLDRPSSGEITVDGSVVTNLSVFASARFRRDRLGFIFQSFNLLPVLNVYENVEFPLLIAGKVTAESRKRIHELIQIVGLTEHMKRRPDELSGGEQQRVAIARALVTEPAIVLADEPTASLDSKTSAQIMDLMTRLNRAKGVTFLFSTH
ncbi:MAG: ABC transporter ATP-binding protein, partial [Actinobacteria bacterium]|nr:ABC transporter ATP-binding protein [Actinomycetota bacterium]